MNHTRIFKILTVLFAVVLCLGSVGLAEPLGTGFTYQGRLIDSNQAADGLYDFQFKLFDNETVGNQLGPDVNQWEVDVIDGYFTVGLDFGSGVFDGDARWLEISVRPGDQNDPCAYTILEPRQEVTPTPYTLYAKTAGSSVIADSDWIISGNNMYSGVSGNVGIGTTSPTGILSISRAVDGIMKIDIENSQTNDGGTNEVIAQNYYFGGVKAAEIQIRKREDFTSSNAEDSAMSFYTIGNGTLNEVMQISPDNRVGLGFDGPFEKLHLHDTNSVAIELSDDQSGPWNGAVLEFDSPLLHLKKRDGSSIMNVNVSNNRVGIGTTEPEAKLEVYGLNEAIRASTDPGPTTGRWIQMRYHSSIGPLIEGDGYPRLTIDADVGAAGTIVLGNEGSGDNVGIGIKNPTAKLHVGGTAGVDGIRFPDGTLQTTAAAGGGGGNTLDQAYDQGGAGAGRTINADAGAVTIIGNYGLDVDDTVRVYSNVEVGVIPVSTAKLEVSSTDRDPVISAKYAGWDPTATAVYGWSAMGDNDGIGGDFTGGNSGVRGWVYPTGNQVYTGVLGFVENIGAGNTGFNYGVRGEAIDGETNYGVYGTAESSNSTINYGVHGKAQNGQYNYGVYGFAPVGTNSYAGYFNGNVYVTNDVSALSFTDRTPYPKDLGTAYEAVMSIQRLPDGQYDEHNKEFQLDHVKLSDFIRSENGNRDLSATVSAHNEVLKDLIRKVEEQRQLIEKQNSQIAKLIEVLERTTQHNQLTVAKEVQQ